VGSFCCDDGNGGAFCCPNGTRCGESQTCLSSGAIFTGTAGHVQPKVWYIYIYNSFVITRVLGSTSCWSCHRWTKNRYQSRGVRKSAVHVSSSFCTILEDAIELFMSQMFSVMVSSFVDLNIHCTPMFVWKMISFCQIVQKGTALFDWCYSSLRNSACFSDKGSNYIWANKWMFISAWAEINVHELINLFVGNLRPLAMSLCLNYKLCKRVQIISKSEKWNIVDPAN